MATLYNIDGITEELKPQHGQYFTLEELQSCVEGYIELIQIAEDEWLIVNEEGKILDLPFNAIATRQFKDPRWKKDYILGRALKVCRQEMEM